jgi:hypothetical protein
MKAEHIKLDEDVGSVYAQHYRKQQQGGTTIFRGSRRWQRGDGIGDIIRGITRFMLPVVLRGVTTFAGETMNANEKGVSLGEAAKGALKPALHAAVQAVSEGFQGGVGQRTPERSKRASGIKRAHNSDNDSDSVSAKRKRTSSGSKRKRTSDKRKSAADTAKQRGRGRQKAAAKRVYKGKSRSVGNQLGGKKSANKARKRAEKKGNSRAATSYANTNF